MKWPIEDVVYALMNDRYPEVSGENELALQIFDAETITGIGVDNLGRRVLVLPGQKNSPSFVTKNAAFDAWNSVTWIGSEQELPPVSTLRCEANFRNSSICEAVAAIFVGLIDIQRRYGSAASAIWEMKELFENGFNHRVADETVVGLFGELLVIKGSIDPNKLISLWHANIEAYFDFSSDMHRVEVKTSKSNLRNHKFSSNQVGTELDKKTTIASVILHLVENGSTLSELVSQIADTLTPENAVKLINTVVGTLGATPETVRMIQIDTEASTDSIKFVAASNVPRPEKTPGVLYMNWVANMDVLESKQMQIREISTLF